MNMVVMFSNPINIFGIFGIFIWGYILVYWGTKTSKVDRFLADNTSLKVILPLIIVLLIPFSLSLLSLLPNVSLIENKNFDSFNNIWLSPFLSHSKDYKISDHLISLLGTFTLSGVVVSLLVNYFNRRAEKWILGESHYNFTKTNYHVIIGSHPSIPYLAKELILANEDDIVIVFSNSDIPDLRRKIESVVENKSKIIMYYGNCDSNRDLSYLNVCNKHLKDIYILGNGKRRKKEDAANDSINMTCYEILKRQRATNKCAKIIDCYVFFEHQSTSLVFQRYNDESKTKESSLNFIPYNFYELQAQKILGWNRLTGDVSVNLNEGINVNSDNHVHLFIIGMSKMGMALGLEAIRICHYPNFAKAQMEYEYSDKKQSVRSLVKRRTKITFIDSKMDEKFVLFKSRYNRLLNEIKYSYINEETKIFNEDNIDKNKPILDIELEFINDWVQSERVYRYINNVCSDQKSIVTIASCLPLANQAIASVLCLPNNALEKASIAVYQPDSDALVNNIKIKLGKKIIPFGMSSNAVCLGHITKLELMAKRISNVYTQKNEVKDYYTTNNLSFFSLDSMKKYEISMKEKLEDSWKSLTELKKWSNRYRASYLLQICDYLDLNNIEKNIVEGIDDQYNCSNRPCDGILARVEHNRYCIERYTLDDQNTDETALLSYRYLDETNNRLYTFPTNDQIMIMSIPYIMNDII